MNTSKLYIRPVNDGDIEMLTAWLNKDYILKWYHDADEWLNEIKERHGEYSWLNHFIVMDGQTPIGFCQYYDCYDANNLEDWYAVLIKGSTFSIDYLIGDEAYLGKGYGKAIIKILTDTIQNIESADSIIVQPEKENYPSVYALKANGYIFDEQKEYLIKTLQ